MLMIKLLESSSVKGMGSIASIYSDIPVIRKVLVQEKEMFEGRKVSDRIVSIDRHYVRPIVRGKENKSVEFGAKVNNTDRRHIVHRTPLVQGIQ